MLHNLLALLCTGCDGRDINQIETLCATAGMGEGNLGLPEQWVIRSEVVRQRKVTPRTYYR